MRSNWNRVLILAGAMSAIVMLTPIAHGGTTSYATLLIQALGPDGKQVNLTATDAGYLNVNAAVTATITPGAVTAADGGSLPVSITSSSAVSLTPGTVTSADGGLLSVVIQSTTLPTWLTNAPDGGLNSIVTQGPWTSSTNCSEITCGTYVDAGTNLPLTAGQHYDAVVDPNAGTAVRILNGTAPNSYAAGPGRYLPSGAILDYVPPSTPDGGAPAIFCVTPIGSTVLQFCPTMVNSH
jgi:hypothetical protein